MTQSHSSKENGIAATLSECTLFATLSMAQLLAVASISRIEEFGKDELILRGGEKPPGVYIVQSGLVVLFTAGRTERQRLYQTIGPGMCFAVTSLIPGETSVFGSRAQSQTAKLIFIPQKPLFELYKTIPQLPVNASAVLYEYMRMMVTHAQRALGRSIETRLAGWLLAQPSVPEEGEKGGAGGARGQTGVVALQIKKTALACDLNVTCQSLSRAFHHFREQGLITTKGRRIHILNRREIEAWASGLHPLKHMKKGGGGRGLRPAAPL